MRGLSVFFSAICLVVVTALLLVLVQPAEASSVCIVMSNESPQFNETVQGFKTYLDQHGPAADINVHALNRDGQQPGDVARSVHQAKAAAVLALGSQAAQIAAQANLEGPVIVALVFAAADIAGLANATGVYLEIPVETQLAQIKRLFPKARRVGVLYSSENQKRIAEASRISAKYGLTIEAQEVASPKEIPSALDWVGKNADILWGVMDKVVLTPETAKHILLFSLRNELAFIGPSENWAKAGAVAAFSWDFEDIGAQCGEILSKLLKGVNATGIPPLAARKTEYALNLKTAEQMKMELSPEIINGSKRVFKGE
jgi:putative ABC transport system substrate-binding protein